MCVCVCVCGEKVNGRKLGHMLVEEYVQYTKLNGRQSPEGEAGHFNACWTHSVSDADVVAIQRGKDSHACDAWHPWQIK